MRLHPLGFDQLPRWSPDEILAAWPAYLASCRAIAEETPPLRAGRSPPPELAALCRRALELSCNPATIQEFFTENFRALEVLGDSGQSEGFVTGYYEPALDGSVTPDSDFSAPVLGRPADLVDMRDADVTGWDRSYEGARRDSNGILEPYPSRAEIENGGIEGVTQPVLWLRDHVEVYFAQVQGSARVRLRDGTRKRLVYAGRNGRPYTSIGRLLIGNGDIPADEMSLARCKLWLRENGLQPGDPGRAVLQTNDSYVFFRLEDDIDPCGGPVGAQGIELTTLRSVAIDRTIWPYGTPTWIFADLSSAGLGAGPAGRMMIAQDTGSAIVGPARADLFIGSGDRAGEIAGLIRHSARFVVFAPVGMACHARS